jgi:hypothetical protein
MDRTDTWRRVACGAVIEATSPACRPDGSWEEAPPACDIGSLSGPFPGSPPMLTGPDLVALRLPAQEALAATEARLRATVGSVLSVRHREVGLAVVGPSESKEHV